MNFQAAKIYTILSIKWEILDAENCFPEWLTKFFRIGITLYRRDRYDRDLHDNDITESEIIYRLKSDEDLIKDYNNLYKFITLRYGYLL